jgi:hypothetical protein
LLQRKISLVGLNQGTREEGGWAIDNNRKLKRDIKLLRRPPSGGRYIDKKF